MSKACKIQMKYARDGIRFFKGNRANLFYMSLRVRATTKWFLWDEVRFKWVSTIITTNVTHIGETLLPEGARTASYLMNEEPLADAIRNVSAGVKKMDKSGLNRDAIIVLLSDRTKVSKKVCGQIIDALDLLAETYCKKD